jgi:hypothetical protein
MREGHMVFRAFHFYAAFLFLVLTAAIPAESEESVSQEIVHLLQYIESSACIFIRNGEEHSAAEARDHIQKKYDHFKSRVKTTEDFIEYAAAKSSMSGKPYMVRCSGQEIRNVDWLNTELQKLRNRP